MRCGEYNRWNKNNWISWNDNKGDTITTIKLIMIEVIITNGIIVITYTQ